MGQNNSSLIDESQHEQVELCHSYHRPQHQQTMDTMGDLREDFKALAHKVVDTVPASRERSLALTAIDEANMWAIAALARHEPEGDGRPNTTSHPQGSIDPGQAAVQEAQRLGWAPNNPGSAQ